jgi:hypothetical protein
VSADNVLPFPPLEVRSEVGRLKPELDKMIIGETELIDAVIFAAATLLQARGAGVPPDPPARRQQMQRLANAFYMAWYASGRVLGVPQELLDAGAGD